MKVIIINLAMAIIAFSILTIVISHFSNDHGACMLK